MKKESAVTLALLGTVLVGASAHADTVYSALKLQSLSKTELILSNEQLQALGFDTSSYVNRLGEERSLLTDEIVKVEVHEEDGVIQFSSFDDYSRTVAISQSSNPRNIRSHEW